MKTQHAYMPPDQIRRLFGKTKEQVRAIMTQVLHAAGIDTFDLKRIHFRRMPNNGCHFQGPARS